MNKGSARTICLTRMAAIPLALFLASSAAGVHESDPVSTGEWLYLGAIAAGLAVLLAIVILADLRHRNPHTGLRSRIRHKRARGPLSKL